MSGEGGLTAEEMTERAAREILDVLPGLLDQKYIAATLVDKLIYDNLNSTTKKS